MGILIAVISIILLLIGSKSHHCIVYVPKLKSNELVVKEIDVYVKNNNKIKSLKEDKINYNADKWWLYFGGMN
jgi:hypothetical protein